MENQAPIFCACGCGQEIKRAKYPSQQKRFINTHQHKGANNGNFRGGKITKVCAVCSDAFECWKSAADNRVTCGKDACYRTWQGLTSAARGQNKITVHCNHCGTALRKFPSQVKERNYCNRHCLAAANPKAGSSNGNWKEGKDKYWMEQARNRDGHQCVICGFDLVVDTHHITPRSEGGARTPDNLITLCPNHHRLADLGIISVEHLRRTDWKPENSANTDWASTPNYRPNRANR